MRYALALVAAFLFLASPAQAQESIVVTQLDSAFILMANQGYAPASDPVISTLEEGDDESFKLALKAGVSYMIVGVCDADCSDLDLVLSDADGAELESDMELDDVPMLAIEPEGAITGIVTVQMSTCSGECVYGVRAFQLSN